jgi:hypothetical protein
MIRLLADIVGVALAMRLARCSEEVWSAVNLGKVVGAGEVGTEPHGARRALEYLVAVLTPAQMAATVDGCLADAA